MEIVKSIKHNKRIFEDKASLSKYLAISYASKLQNASNSGADNVIEIIKHAYDDIIELEDLDI